MELYQLRTFVAVAREGSLTRAAEQLFTSQPAISAQIKALEEEFGLKLFDRSPSGMTPTPAGEELWADAERLLNASRDLCAHAAALQGQVAGRLRLGLNNDDSVLRSDTILSHLATAHPRLSFQINQGSSGAVLQGVLNRDLDACFYEGTCDDAQVELVPLTQLDLVIALPRAWADSPDHPDWSRLAAHPWVFGSPGCSYYRLIARLVQEHGIAPQARFEVEFDTTAIGLVSRGSAITLTTREALRHHLHENSPIVIWPHFQHRMPLSLAYLASRRDDPVIRALRDASQTVWAPPAAATVLQAASL